MWIRGGRRHRGYALVKSADLPLDLDIIAITPTGGVNVFTDDPLVPGVTPVKAVHFRELRRASTHCGRGRACRRMRGRTRR